jgi:hypothetical protein
VVSRDHLDLDAGAPAGSDGAARLGAGRIDHRHEAEEGELRDVVVGGAAGVRQALGLKEVLTAATFREAKQILDELGLG